MFGGKALGWMAGTLMWMPGARRVRGKRTLVETMVQFHYAAQSFHFAVADAAK